MFRIIIVLTGLLLLGGCAQPYVTPERLEKGLVIVLPGIEGRSIFNTAICDGLDEGGIEYAIELNDWTTKLPFFYLLNLQTENHNRGKAMKIADRIVKYKIDYPGRPVFLVGQSGGAAMAVWVCEYMSWGQKIDGAFLLAAALSQEYPLNNALKNVNRGIVNYYSTRDAFFLGFGTTLYGTMDRKHQSAAGRYGFKETWNREGYEKLYQVLWSEKMFNSGHAGLHLTSGSPDFVAKYVAPLIKEKYWEKNSFLQVSQE